jgi:hypothetical protein
MVMDVLPENRLALTMIADHWPVARYDHSAQYVTISVRLPSHLNQPDCAARCRACGNPAPAEAAGQAAG